jgi:hypothetical protein
MSWAILDKCKLLDPRRAVYEVIRGILQLSSRINFLTKMMDEH